jgi:hypothetical protein
VIAALKAAAWTEEGQQQEIISYDYINLTASSCTRWSGTHQDFASVAPTATAVDLVQEGHRIHIGWLT